MTLKQQDRDAVITYRIEQAYEAIGDTQLLLNNDKLKIAVN